MAFHNPHDMQAFYRVRDVNRLSDWTAYSRAVMGVRFFKMFPLALVDAASKNLDQTTLSQITPAQLMRKAKTVRNTQVTLSGETPMELAHGTKTKRSP